MRLAVQTAQLSRHFAALHAVDSLDLRVPEGSVFGSLGPNGAGKTTTIRMRLGLIRPSRRLALARALIGQPRLVILDEPTNGLDPAGIVQMRELIRELPQRFGTTVMLSSHLLSEIEQTADHCALIAHG